MKVNIRFLLLAAAIAALFVLTFSSLQAQDAAFHSAPSSASKMKNPYAGQSSAARTGGELYAADCSKCHGMRGEGTGNVPGVMSGPTQAATDGELFWFITKGDLQNGMPAWSSLSAKDRWQIVTYVKTMAGGHATQPLNPVHGHETGEASLPPPQSPFTDYRYEKPGTFRKITVNDLPAPYVTKSAENGPEIVPRPDDAWPQAPTGFKVGLYATGLENPRLIRTAPNGDFFLAESSAGVIKVFRGISADGKPETEETFASGLDEPYGIAFYPPGSNPKYLYVGDTNAVVRFPYENGDMKARGGAEHIVDLPSGRGHWTRDVRFTPDGKEMLVSDGSASNVDDSDTSPAEKHRADILEFNPDGSDLRVYAWGIRNAGGGIAIDPKTGELWCSTNERDGLGDNLVPDYITHVQEGGFYGWPWWYMGGHQDPRHEGKHPELKDKVITPDVILQPHNASLEITFYEGKEFPAEYRGDIFASEHGSWNKSVRAGYEVIRVPLHQTGHASGDYEDFITGFVLPDGNVWGRPVGITVAPDGSLLFTDDGSNSIWRVTYTGK